ncbi:MAG: hypothetical protein ACXWX9_11115 [Actinomycetota bacterium]
MRRTAAIAALVLSLAALVACDGEDRAAGPTPSAPPSASPSPTATTPPPEPSPTAEPSPSPRPFPPVWAAPIEADVAPDELADADLVPPDALITDRVSLPAAGGVLDQVAVAYTIGEDPFAAEHGLAVWQRFAEAPAWSVVLVFVDAPDEGVLGIDLQTGDVTGDGHDDVLAFEQTGGSGACGRWRVLAAAGGTIAQVFSKRTCDTQITLVAGALEMREAVFEPDDAHCCPSAFRTTTLAWDSEAFVETDVREEPAPDP